jgi:peptide deformylase
MLRWQTMIRPLLRMGHPTLRLEAQEVKGAFFKTTEFKELLNDLTESMHHYGGIGLAAPQIGVSLKMAVIELPTTNRYGQEVKLDRTFFINPKMKVLDSTHQSFWEGCLSVPGLRGLVPRPQKIEVSYLDELGQSQTMVADGFLATVIQHELDHLWGKLYVDRMTDMSKLVYQEEFLEFYQSGAQVIDDEQS